MNELGLKSDLVDKSSWDFFLPVLLLTILTLSSLIFIAWTGYEQIQRFKTNQQELLRNSVAAVAAEIADLIEERSRIITAIAHDKRQLLDRIISEPDNESLIIGFEQQLRTYYPDLFAFTLTDPNGKRVPDDLDERVGSYCIEEIRRYLQGDTTLFFARDGMRYYRPIIHPQPFFYHFDIMGLWSEHAQPPRILFLNFSAQLLTKLIKTYQLPGHTIYLVRADQPSLIEIGAEGARDAMARPTSLSMEERDRIIGELDVVGTRWRAVGLFQPNLLAQFNHEVIERYVTIGLVILAFWLVSMLILYRLRRHKQSTFQQLHMLNQKLEAKVADRTKELSKLSKAVAQSPVEILITDVRGIIEYVNPMFTDLSGYARHEVLGTHINDLKTAWTNKRLLREIWQTLIKGNSWHGDMMNQHKNGRQYWIRFSISPVRDNAGQITHFIGIGEDITQKREHEEKIRYQAQYDVLTGLPNRALAQDRLQQAIRMASRSNDKVALIFVDLDDFKQDTRPVGCEALLRWRNPLLGTVEPERFIPVAEQTGLIIPIGEFVMREACRVIAGWNKHQATQLYVAVNLSPRQFWHGSFTERVAGILIETGLAGQYLELELTEGMIIRDHRNTGQIMQDLSALGIKLAMDDFGTGYSSLYQLKRFPFDKLKIDRSFVQDLERDRDDDAVVRAAVALAHGLDLEIVAEGIERESQRNMLRNEKCEYGQGFLFSRAIDAGALHEFLQDRLQQQTAV